MKQNIIIFLIYIIILSCRASGPSDFVHIATEPRYSPDGKEIIFSIIKKSKAYIIQYDLQEKKEKILNNKETNKCFFPAFSSNGKYITFVESIYKEEKLFYDEIFIMNRDGTNVKQLTHADEYSHYPIFSPDNKKIYFARKPEKKSLYEIYSINIDGTEEKKISKNNYYRKVYNPSITNDEKFMIFSTNITGTIRMVFIKLDLETGEQTILLGYSEIDEQRIKQEEKKGIYNLRFIAGKITKKGKIIYGLYNQITKENSKAEAGIYIMDFDGSNQKQLFKPDFLLTWEQYLDISPDEKKVLFINRSNDLIESNLDGTDMHKIEISGIRISNLLNENITK